ncbi:MAG TPA: hypothetical protein VFC07_05605 [Verrucomicrobiae bacterium]|nr:hypothetical protein [Verrucomicrobiae bacterium]
MKTSRAFALVATALIVGFLAARWCAAQPPRQPSSKKSATDDYVALHQLEPFVAYLQETKQTNILQRFGDYLNTTIVSEKSADLSWALHVLQGLRNGHTNDAFELLEGRVRTDIIFFAASYRELPAPLREKVSLKILGYARDYRAKFPFKSRFPNAGEGVAEAFKILDEKKAK